MPCTVSLNPAFPDRVAISIVPGWPRCWMVGVLSYGAWVDLDGLERRRPFLRGPTVRIPVPTAASHVAAALEPVPHEQGKRGADASARQLLVAGLASQDDRDDAEQGKAGHDRRGVGQAAELDDQQAGPFHVIGVTRHRFSRSIQKPGRASRRLHAGCRSGRLQGIPRADPGGRVTPRF